MVQLFLLLKKIFHDILNIILSCVVGVIPSFMIVVYSIYDLKFNRFKKDII